MKFAVDPWDPAYGSSLETEMTQSEAIVVTEIEVEDRAWAPIRPGAVPEPSAIVFVDGVRRLEARTWIEHPDGTDAEAGIFASYAAGSVRCDGEAKFVEARVGRGVFSPSAHLDNVVTRHGVFLACQSRDATMESMTYEVHQLMSECEVEVAEETRRNGTELLLLDGPLRQKGHIPDAVGLVKTHQVRYLPPELDRVVGLLGAGERTPVFRVDAQPFSRCSWYTRLPGPNGGPWAGIMRCEVTGALPLPDVVALADAVTITLPRFASEPHKDARAPQNLYPIGGLERELRRRLGDQRVLYRALRRASTSAPLAAPI
jgi:hypothetical protein